MKQSHASIIPTMRYKNAPAAVDWLCNTLGFSRHLVVEGENNIIEHAQLVLGNSMVMLGSERNNEYGNLLKIPEDFEGFNTQTPYIIIEQIEEHYRRARHAGAEIVLDLEDQSYGGKLYTCRDPEGYLWNIGSYNPWEVNGA